jgi:Ca-activated chloride channel homolog
MTSDRDPGHDDLDLAGLQALAKAATPQPDATTRAAHLRLARENFARLHGVHQGSPTDARPNLANPAGGFWQGAKDMLKAMTSRERAVGGLTATTAIVACGLLILTPGGQAVWRGTTISEADVRLPVPPLPPPTPEIATQEIAAQEMSTQDFAAQDMTSHDAAPLVEAPTPEPAAGAARAVNESTGRTFLSAPSRILENDKMELGATAGIMAAPAAPMVRGLPANRMEMPVPEIGTEAFANATDNPVRITAEEPVSTFSIDVDTASYAIVRRSLNAGQLPPLDAVRIEEMVNYFRYAYPAPEPGSGPFRPTVTVMGTPWNADTRLVHIGIQGALPAIADRPALNLVFLIDTSGSMEAADKLPLLKQSFRLLVDQLRPEDQVAIVEYAGSAGLVLPPTPAADRSAILRAIGNLGAGGATNGQGGLEQAYDVARGMMTEGEVSRIILTTDGDFNVGATDLEELTSFVARQRSSGVYLSVLGFGRGNLDDATMQTLAQNGNGIAAYIDTLNEAQKVLVDQLTGTLFPIAGDVKVQVEFNPAVVAEYRLIGYETRALARQDFNNDRVDAGELGAGHAVTAIYEITPVGSPAQLSDPLRYDNASVTPEESDELGFLRLRWKAPGATESQLLETPILPSDDAAGTEALFAAAIAGFGQLLREQDAVAGWGWDAAIALADANRGQDPFGYRAEAVQLMRLAQSLSRD